MGLKLIEFCKSHDLQILNGRSIGDPHGCFSFYDTKQGASAIDLAIASDPIAKEVETFTINNPVDYTHHCKIELRLNNIVAIPEKEEEEYTWIELGDKYRWKDDSEGKFQEALKDPKVVKLANECNQYLDAGLVELASNKLISMYIEAANISLEKKNNPKRKENNPAYISTKRNGKNGLMKSAKFKKTSQGSWLYSNINNQTTDNLELSTMRNLRTTRNYATRRKVNLN